MLHEYEGTEAPDKITDPIGYAEWVEANKCPDCFGSGHYLPKTDHPREIYKARFGCATCRGEGVAPHLFDPDF